VVTGQQGGVGISVSRPGSRRKSAALCSERTVIGGRAFGMLVALMGPRMPVNSTTAGRSNPTLAVRRQGPEGGCWSLPAPG
jgi:hypothetical protein